MKKISLLVLVLLSTVHLFAQAKKQKATIFFKNGTELNCFARIAGERIRYSDVKMTAKETLVDHNEVVSVNIWIKDNLKELVYKTEAGKDKPNLMEKIVTGKMNLYRISNVYERSLGFDTNADYFKKSAATVYFLETKENKETLFRIGKNFDKTVKEHFADCSILVEKIGQDNFRKKDILKIVLFYNENCNK